MFISPLFEGINTIGQCLELPFIAYLA